MRKIRKKVFETNSSSVHTLECVPTEEDFMEKPDYKGESCEIPLCEFGWSGECETWKQKLAYLILMIWETLPYDKVKKADAQLWCGNVKEYASAIKLLTEQPAYKSLEEVILPYINASSLEITGSGYIDHQSYEDYENLEDWLVSNNVGTSDQDILMFVFGKASITISNDNVDW